MKLHPITENEEAIKEHSIIGMDYARLGAYLLLMPDFECSDAKIVTWEGKSTVGTPCVRIGQVAKSTGGFLEGGFFRLQTAT